MEWMFASPKMLSEKDRIASQKKRSAGRRSPFLRIQEYDADLGDQLT